MRIAELFDTPVAEKIEPVIKVGERGDAHKLALEIGSYVVTPMIEKYLDDILEHFTDTFFTATTEIGTWTGDPHKSEEARELARDREANDLPKLHRRVLDGLETELRGIESTPADARSDRQEKRRVELESQIDELRQFDTTLQEVINKGFASKELEKIVKAGEPLDRWCSLDGRRAAPETAEGLLQQESRYFPDINDGVRVNIAPLQKAGLLAADVLAKKDLDKAIADRAQWRADERRWCRESKLPQPGWWEGHDV